MVPYDEPLLVPTFGLSKLVWFGALIASAVKRSVQPSRILNTLRSETSHWTQSGPSITPTPAVPSAFTGALVNAAVLNHSFFPGLEIETGWPSYEERRVTPVELPVGVRYAPVWKRTMPLNSQPANTPPTMPLWLRR